MRKSEIILISFLGLISNLKIGYLHFKSLIIVASWLLKILFLKSWGGNMIYFFCISEQPESHLRKKKKKLNFSVTNFCFLVFKRPIKTFCLIWKKYPFVCGFKWEWESYL